MFLPHLRLRKGSADLFHCFTALWDTPAFCTFDWLMTFLTKKLQRGTQKSEINSRVLRLQDERWQRCYALEVIELLRNIKVSCCNIPFEMNQNHWPCLWPIFTHHTCLCVQSWLNVLFCSHFLSSVLLASGALFDSVPEFLEFEKIRKSRTFG